MSEQSAKAPIPQPAAELEVVFAAAQGAEIQSPVNVEEFLTKEPLTARARRIGQRAMYGKNTYMHRSNGSVVDTMKPARYDVAGYVENVANAIDSLVAETGEFPEALYDVAKTAAATINQEKRDYRYFSDDPQGVEAVGLLKAITSRPAFIKNPRAEEVLSQLGKATHQVCNENMFIDDRYGRQPKMKDGYDVSFTQDFQRIATSDVLWDKLKDSEARWNVKWPLSAAAAALKTLAVNHPSATQEARLDVLKKNEASGGLADVYYYLVYSFNTDEEKTFLADAAAKDVQQETGSRVAQNILDGRYDRVMWG
jgi:hypothetical protein